MKYFRTFLRLGIRQIFTKRNIALILLILFLSLYSTQKGINEYKKELDKIEEFKKSEIQFFNGLRNYLNYSFNGFKILFIPDDVSFYFPNPIYLNELLGRVNSIQTLEIILKSESVFKGNSFYRFRQSNIFLVFGSFLAFFLGYGEMKNKKYLNFLNSKLGFFITHLLQFVRLILLFFGILIIICICLSLAKIQGIQLTHNDITLIAITLIPLVLMLMFCYIIGTIVGSIKSRYAGNTINTILLGIWFSFIFIYPTSIESWIEDKSNGLTPLYEFDSAKKKIGKDFEERAERKYGKYTDNTKAGRIKVIEGYLKEDFPEIESVDENSKKETAQLIEKYNNISLLLPTTFYKLTCEEASSRGYQAYLDFYSYLQDLRRRFALFWFDQVYYKESKKVVNFVQHDENLFYSKSHIPSGYGLGILISLGEIILLYIISFLLFKRSVAHITSREIAEMGEVRLQLDVGEHRVWAEKDHRFGSTLYHAFHGHIKLLKKLGFQGEIVVDDIDITQEKNSHPFIYICHYRDLPQDIKVKDLLCLYAVINKIDKESSAAVMKSKELTPLLGKTIAELDDIDKFEVVMGFLRMEGNNIYLLDNISSGVPIHCAVKLRQQMVEMAKHAIVILLISPKEINQEQLPNGDFYAEGTAWEYGVKSHEHSLLMSARIEKEEKEQ